MGEICITDEIREELDAQKDTAYRDFQAKLIPTIDKETVIGVRTPALRKMAKQMAKREEIGEFLRILPHTYFEETSFTRLSLRRGRTLRSVWRSFPFFCLMWITGRPVTSCRRRCFRSTDRSFALHS